MHQRFVLPFVTAVAALLMSSPGDALAGCASKDGAGWSGSAGSSAKDQAEQLAEAILPKAADPDAEVPCHSPRFGNEPVPPAALGPQGNVEIERLDSGRVILHLRKND